MRPWANPVAGASDRHQPGQKPVDREADVPFLAQQIRCKHRGKAGGAGCQSGIGRDPADAVEVHRGKRAAGVEAIPSEPQEQTARCGDRQIVRQHGSAAVTLEFPAYPRPEDDRAGQSDEAADGVNDGRSREIMEARSHPTAGSCPRCPWWPESRPDPMPSGR